eukprot:732874_1
MPCLDRHDIPTHSSTTHIILEGRQASMAFIVTQCHTRIRFLNRGNEGLAGELKRSQVGNSDNISSSRGVKDDVKRVEQTIVGEYLVLLLEVIGTIQKLHLGIELTSVRVKEDLDLIHGGVKVDGVHGTSLDVSALVGAEEVRALSHHGGTGVSRGGIEGEVARAGVVDVDGRGLVPRPDETLDGAHHAVFGVGLDLHGSPVGSDPELDEGLDGSAVGVDADLDDLLVGVGELPVLAGGTLDADGSADVGEVPFGCGGRKGGFGGCRSGGVHGEGIGRGGGKSNEEAGEELHGEILVFWVWSGV